MGAVVMSSGFENGAPAPVEQVPIPRAAQPVYPLGVSTRRIGITLGDPSGIGPEIIARTLADEGRDVRFTSGFANVLEEAPPNIDDRLTHGLSTY